MFLIWNILAYYWSDNEIYNEQLGAPKSCLERMMRNKYMRASLLITISMVNLIDTYLDVTFLVLTYVAKLIWIVVPVTICYILVFSAKIYCIKTLVKFVMEQWRSRRIYNMLKKPKLKF